MPEAISNFLRAIRLLAAFTAQQTFNQARHAPWHDGGLATVRLAQCVINCKLHPSSSVKAVSRLSDIGSLVQALSEL